MSKSIDIEFGHDDIAEQLRRYVQKHREMADKMDPPASQPITADGLDEYSRR